MTLDHLNVSFLSVFKLIKALLVRNFQAYVYTTPRGNNISSENRLVLEKKMVAENLSKKGLSNNFQTI